ncbi:MAG TPA: hypothetical protein VG755_04715 [Nannocystaceae bacterium]|nr:hypothetical protein [Nannocystaceae bacterium]
MRIVAALVLASALVACDPGAGEDACGVANRDLSMVATVVDNGADIHAEVDFSRVDAEIDLPLALCDTDELKIAGRHADRIDRADRVVYAITVANDSSRTVGFELARTDETTLHFEIELPPAFAISAPLPGDEVSRSADFMLGWDPPLPGTQIHISLAEEIGYGVCLETMVAEHDYKNENGVAVDDDGGWQIPASVIDGGTRDKCDATYRLTRFSSPGYPAELHAGGVVEGRVERTVAFISVP